MGSAAGTVGGRAVEIATAGDELVVAGGIAVRASCYMTMSGSTSDQDC